VDARGYFTGGGIGRYTRNLVRELAAAPTGAMRLRLLISNRHHPADLDVTLRGNIEVVVSRAEWLNAGEEDRWLEQETDGSDLFHSLTGHWLPRGVPAVATLHDLTPIVRPRLVGREVRAMGRRIADTLPRASHVIAVSNATAADARVVLGARMPPTSVVYEAAAPQFHPGVPTGNTLTRFGLLARGFVLSVSAFTNHKNLPRLIAAYAASRIPSPLVIVGAQREATARIRSEIARLDLGGRVRLLGRITDEDLAGLYSTCRLFVYPSLYEGFGLPVIEAMACGAAVITSNRSSVPEVAGDAAQLVDVCRTDRLGAAMARLDGDEALRTRLRSLALERAAAFSWARTAAQTMAVYGAVTPNAQAA
jgi:glycosyltransferase involved in cell wall biosynthesis